MVVALCLVVAVCGLAVSPIAVFSIAKYSCEWIHDTWIVGMNASARSMLDWRRPPIRTLDFELCLLMASLDRLPCLLTDSADKLLFESGDATEESRYPESGEEQESGLALSLSESAFCAGEEVSLLSFSDT